MKCICKIRNWFSNLGKTQDTKPQKESKYHSLTPINCADNCEVYMDALQQALQNPDIKNIAVTGPYGAGKSSVIRTFFDKHNGEYKHITITLANFLDNNIQEDTTTQKQQEQTATKKGNNTPKGSEDTPKNNQKDTPQKTSTITGDDLEQLIERSIVQQLFYSVNDSSIPASHFKKIKKQDKFELFCIVSFILLCLLSVSYLLHPDILWSILKVKNVPVIIDNILRVLALFFAVWGIYEAIKKVVQIAISISVKQLHIKEAGIELDKQEHKSILNYHIDEIIYFFEATEKNVVVIEDIDRFNHQGIFTKLREINYLINNCEKIHQKVVFIYALKDEMFQDKDRTKFFDFIIPIVPIINSSNSSEILRKEFLTDSQKTDITEDVINDISLFIDDMRLLYNIINEYKIYNQRMSACTFDNNRLLAMIAYKNLFPKDFTQLSQGKGCLYNVIAQKEKIVQELIYQYRSEIKSISNKIKQIEEQERPKNLQELRILYLSKIVDKLQTIFYAFYFDNKRISIYDCAKNDDYFDKIRTGSFTIYNKNGYTSSQTINFSAIEYEVDPHMTYQQREELLNQSQIKPLQQQIKQLENKIEAVQSYTLQELIVEGKIKITDVYKNTDKTNLDNTKQIELINILLRNGYINEIYIEYISIFHPGSLTPEDKQFVLNVLMAKTSPYDYPLYMIDNVLQRIAKKNPAILKQQYTLNFNLMDYILTKASLLYSEPYLIQLQTTNWDFIIKYIERGKNLNYFMDEIAKRRRLFLDYVHSFIPNQLDNYIKLLIVHAQTETLLSFFSTENKNIKYLNSYADFMLLEDEQKKYELVNELNIKFALLSKETSPKDLDYIYRRNAYQINIDVMRTILSKREQWDDLAFNTRNYSYIMETYPEMAKYIQDNLSEYVDNVFLQLTNNNDIKIEHLIELLNTETLPVDQKKQIINHVTATNPIECITDIADTSLWAEICNNNLMAANWENIKALVYSDEINFAEVYTNFLNKEEIAKQLSDQKLEEDINLDEGKAEIAYTLIYNPNLKDKSYQLLLNSFTGVYSLESTDLSENKVRWLLEKNLIEINVDSYKYLKEHYTPLHIDFLEKHLADFSKSNYQNMDFDAEDMKPILNLNIEVSEKVKIIDSIVDTSIFENQDEVIQLLASIVLYHFKDHQPKTNIIEYLSLQKALTVDIRKRIYIKYAQYIKDITTFLTNLEEPYSSLLQKDIDTYIPMEDEVFLNTLKEHQHIGPFKKRRNRELWIIKKDAKLFR